MPQEGFTLNDELGAHHNCTAREYPDGEIIVCDGYTRATTVTTVKSKNPDDLSGVDYSLYMIGMLTSIALAVTLVGCVIFSLIAPWFHDRQLIEHAARLDNLENPTPEIFPED